MNKVLYYPDSNSKLKVIKGKVSTKNIIPDMGHGRPIDFSYIRRYSILMLSHVSIVEGYFHCTRYRVSRQYSSHGQIRLLNQTRPKISLGILQQIKTD